VIALAIVRLEIKRDTCFHSLSSTDRCHVITSSDSIVDFGNRRYAMIQWDIKFSRKGSSVRAALRIIEKGCTDRNKKKGRRFCKESVRLLTSLWRQADELPSNTVIDKFALAKLAPVSFFA
jgi:hypothetical protein